MAVVVVAAAEVAGKTKGGRRGSLTCGRTRNPSLRRCGLTAAAVALMVRERG